MHHSAEIEARCADLLTDYDYALPAELIAQQPARARESARLLVLDRARRRLEHTAVSALPAYLRPGDVLVVNDTRVRPARLYARSERGGVAELLLIRAIAPGTWEALGKPSKRLQPGSRLELPGGVTAVVAARGEMGRCSVSFPASVDVAGLLARHGDVPLPPYIKRPSGALPIDRERYQTVFAAHDGAVAAPTAGLHLTHELLAVLRSAGVIVTAVTLHVGPGTFLPVRADDIGAHRMEPEWASISEETATAVAAARREHRRIVAVGTTTVRALESAAVRGGHVEPGEGWARAFIVPGHRFRAVGALLTNFHLPRSTLLMLVAAFAGREAVLHAYGVAVKERYRFYSYGDAMLVA